MNKKASDSHIRLNKRITNPRIIGGVNAIAEERGKTPAEVCYDIIAEAAAKENKKRLEKSLYGGLSV